MAAGFVQANGVQGTNITSVNIAFSAAVAVDNLIWAGVGWTTAGVTITVTDNSGGGHTYINGTLESHSGVAALQARMSYVRNTVNAAHTVTVTSTATTVRIALRIAEVSGVDLTSPLEDESTGEGNNAGCNAGSVTAVDTGIALTNSMSNTNVVYTLPPSYTAAGTATLRSQGAYLVIAAPATVDANWTADVSASVVATIALFRSAVAAGGGIVRQMLQHHG
jgi:hypothetical protein